MRSSTLLEPIRLDALQDGDICIEQIRPLEFKGFNTQIFMGQYLQKTAYWNPPFFGSMNPYDGHVSMVVEMRDLNQKRSAHVATPPYQDPSIIHMTSTKGIVRSVLKVDRHAEKNRTMIVLRCKNAKWAEQASQTAIQFLLNKSEVKTKNFQLQQYSQVIGMDVVARYMRNFAAIWLASYTYSAFRKTGWECFRQLITPTGLKWAGVALLVERTLSYFGSSGAITMQSMDDEMMTQLFQQYYDAGGKMRPGIPYNGFCASFIVLCYQLAYAKLVKYLNHRKNSGGIGPQSVTSPMAMVELFLASGLFEKIGYINAKGVAVETESAGDKEILISRANKPML